MNKFVEAVDCWAAVYGVKAAANEAVLKVVGDPEQAAMACVLEQVLMDSRPELSKKDRQELAMIAGRHLWIEMFDRRHCFHTNAGTAIIWVAQLIGVETRLLYRKHETCLGYLEDLVYRGIWARRDAV